MDKASDRSCDVHEKFEKNCRSSEHANAAARRGRSIRPFFCVSTIGVWELCTAILGLARIKMQLDLQSTTYWLGEFRRDNPAARDQLIAIMNARLRAIASAMLRGFPLVGQIDDTDDVWQEAAMRLCRALDAIPPAERPDCSERFVALACLQMRRTLIDLARQYAGKKQRLVGQPMHLPRIDGATNAIERVDTTHDPEHLAIWTEFHLRVEDLPPELLAVFNLVYYAGLNFTEASQTLGCSRQTVMRRYRLAVEQMAQYSPIERSG
ncbi:MAG: sigma-70 family RNA polymerase sigma factor [Planctomycetales bacterium]|nr:sigma-70 family RNA polymerase sigma factor [Planctomycetales bacterium]